MISNHLSLVEQLRPKSNELAAQVAQFLASGGQIKVAEPIGYKPKPITYSNHARLRDGRVEYSQRQQPPYGEAD